MMKSVVPDNACRLCLRVTKTHFRLSDIYKDFIENALHKEIKYIPQEDFTACNICLYLVSKSFDFIQMICNTQKIIHELLVNNNCGKLTVPILENINRDEIGLTKFSTTTFTIIDINGSCDNGYFWKETEKEASNEYDKSEELNKIETSDINQDENIEALDEDKYLSDDCAATDPMEVFTEANNPSPTVTLENLSETRKNNEVIITSSKISHPGSQTCGEPSRLFRPFPKFMVINISDSEEETVKNVKEGFNYTVVDKKKRLERTKIKTAKDKPPFVPTAMNTEPIKPRPRRKYCFEAENSSDSNKTQNKRFCKKVDTDYCPDSTSHSEDSVYDSFDDEGKQIPIPKDNRVYPMTCDHCDYNIPKRAEHYRHYVFDHPNVEYPYPLEKTTCSICGKLYPPAKIRTHELNHIKMKIKCTDCPRVFINQRSMRSHRWVYHRSKSFTCDYCSKTVNTRNELVRHLRIHTGEKPYKCHICDAAFAHCGNRTLHIRSTHQNIKIVPKKKKGNKRIRKHKKNHYTDSELESTENEMGHTRRKSTKIVRKKRNNKENLSKIKTVNNRNIHQNLKNNDNRIETMSNNDKQTRKRKKDKKKVCRANKSDKVRSKESEEVDTDSDDEILADKKAKRTIIDHE